jgi:DnaJ-class molecular chaperone
MSELSKREAARILGVWEDASEKEIKLAYKKLAIRWHPGSSNSPLFSAINREGDIDFSQTKIQEIQMQQKNFSL